MPRDRRLEYEIQDVVYGHGRGMYPQFSPPSALDVLDRRGGFTIVDGRDARWQPARVAPRGTVGRLDETSVDRDDFYQDRQPLVSALYALPGYPHPVKVWWTPDGERVA